MGLEAHAVVFTTSVKGSVSREVTKKAQNDRISIISKEDIDRLVSMAERHAHAGEVVKFIYRCVPDVRGDLFAGR